MILIIQIFYIFEDLKLQISSWKICKNSSPIEPELSELSKVKKKMYSKTLSFMQVTYADSTVDWIFYVSFQKKYSGYLILSLRLLQLLKDQLELRINL